MQIKGSVALVTGANGGLGKAFVRKLLDAGAAKVYAAVHDPWAIQAAPGIVPLKLDATKPEEIAAAGALAKDVTLLINNARISGLCGGEGSSINVATLRREIKSNAIGPLATSLAFAPILAANGGGAIVNMHSTLSWINLPNSTTYSASKAAVWTLTNGLRLQLAEQGTLVVGVHVAFMDTDMSRGLEGVQQAVPHEIVQRVLDGVEKDKSEVLADGPTEQIKRNLSYGISLRPLPMR